MKRLLAAIAVLTSATVIAIAPADAAARGGHGGGFHGGGFHGHGFHHGFRPGFRGSVFIGIGPYWDPYWWPYYYPRLTRPFTPLRSPPSRRRTFNSRRLRPGTTARVLAGITPTCSSARAGG